MRMLLVEDSSDDARLLERLIPADLRREVTIDRASTLCEACLKAPAADLIVVDSSLPDAQGAEAALRLMELTSLAHTVMWTGSYNPDDVDAFAAAGGNGVVLKGGRRDQAEAALRSAIGRAISLRNKREDLAGRIEHILDRRTEIIGRRRKAIAAR